MSVTRMVNMAFLAVGFLVWIVMGGFYAWLLHLIKAGADVHLIGAGFRLSDLLGLATGAAAGIVLMKHETVNTLAHEIANELQKVTWPTWQETRVATVVVVVVTAIFALLFAGYDAIWTFLTSWIYNV